MDCESSCKTPGTRQTGQTPGIYHPFKMQMKVNGLQTSSVNSLPDPSHYTHLHIAIAGFKLQISLSLHSSQAAMGITAFSKHLNAEHRHVTDSSKLHPYSQHLQSKDISIIYHGNKKAPGSQAPRWLCTRWTGCSDAGFGPPRFLENHLLTARWQTIR